MASLDRTEVLVRYWILASRLLPLVSANRYGVKLRPSLLTRKLRTIVQQKRKTGFSTTSNLYLLVQDGHTRVMTTEFTSAALAYLRSEKAVLNVFDKHEAANEAGWQKAYLTEVQSM